MLHIPTPNDKFFNLQQRLQNITSIINRWESLADVTYEDYLDIHFYLDDYHKQADFELIISSFIASVGVDTAKPLLNNLIRYINENNLIAQQRKEVIKGVTQDFVVNLHIYPMFQELKRFGQPEDIPMGPDSYEAYVALLNAVEMQDIMEKRANLEMVVDIDLNEFYECETLLREIYDHLVDMRLEYDELRGYDLQAKDLVPMHQMFATVLNRFLSDIDSCSSSPQKALQKSPSGNNIPMRILGAVYELCNDRQFQPISEIEFFNFFNASDSDAKIVVKKGEDGRVSILVRLLSDLIQQESRKEWTAKIIAKLNIDMGSFTSKSYCGSDSSKKTLKFAKSLEDIFKNDV